MECCAQEDIFFHNVRRQAKASPIEADIEVAVAVEVVRSEEHVEIADSMDDDENTPGFMATTLVVALLGAVLISQRRKKQ